MSSRYRTIHNLDEGGDGGQRGSPPSFENQQVTPPNSSKCPSDNVDVPQSLPTQEEAAARWLLLNRETVSGQVIPTLRCRFGLSNLQAIEAAKLAHALEYPGEGR